MDTNTRPNNCPFCGSPQTGAFECDVGAWAVSCSSCLAIGPAAASAAAAIDRWNAVATGGGMPASGRGVQGAADS